MESTQLYVGKPYLHMQRSKSGKSTSVHWDDGSLTDIGRAVLGMEWERLGVAQEIGDLFRANAKRVRGSELLGGGDIGYWSRCPNDTADTVFALIAEAHRVTVEILGRMTREQREAWRRGEVTLPEWVSLLEQVEA